MQWPQPRNAAAQRVLDARDKIEPFLAGGQFTSWMAAVIHEMNRLDADTDVRSALNAAVNCAMLGLAPGGSTGYCFFVAFKGQCQLLPGYYGYIELAFANNFLRDLHTDVVTKEEEPEFRHWKNSDGPQIEHQVHLDRDISWQNIVASYCLYTTKDGGRGMRVVDKRELEAVSAQKRASRGTNPWKTHPAAMCEKTAIIRCAKRWRKSRELALALRLDDQAEIGAEQTPEVSLDAENGLMDLSSLK